MRSVSAFLRQMNSATAQAVGILAGCHVVMAVCGGLATNMGPLEYYWHLADGSHAPVARMVTFTLMVTFVAVKVFSASTDAGAERQASSLSEPNALKLFRWFVPRHRRCEIDLIINDIRQDAEQMRAEGRHKAAIWAMKTWHTFTSISSFLWDGASIVLRKVLPAFRLAQQIQRTARQTEIDETVEN